MELIQNRCIKSSLKSTNTFRLFMQLYMPYPPSLAVDDDLFSYLGMACAPRAPNEAGASRVILGIKYTPLFLYISHFWSLLRRYYCYEYAT